MNGTKATLAALAALAAAGAVAKRRRGSSVRTKVGLQRGWKLFGVEGDDFYEQQDDYDLYELMEQAESLFRRVEIRPDSTKQLCVVAIDEASGTVIGAVECGISGDTYGFDTAVDPDYHGRGVGRALIDWALADYDWKAEDWSFASDAPLDIVLDIVNPKMISVFERRGFEITSRYPGHVRMRRTMGET